MRADETAHAFVPGLTWKLSVLRMLTVDDLDESKLDEYLALIDKKIDATGGHDWSCLSDAERTTITAYFFALEVSNGGIEQFFLNRGDQWRETLQAIKTVGATRLAKLFEKALTVFPDQVPSADPVTRCNQLVAAGEAGVEFLWNLSGEYYDLQASSPEHCLYQRLTAFATKQLAGENTD